MHFKNNDPALKHGTTLMVSRWILMLIFDMARVVVFVITATLCILSALVIDFNYYFFDSDLR